MSTTKQSCGTAALALFLGVAGCGLFGSSTVGLVASPQSPAAQGSVKTKTTSDQNTKVTVKVKHLAPPQKIAQGATTYVVWVRPLGVPAARETPMGAYPERESAGVTTEKGIYNIGGLKIGKNLDGELETVTPFKSFELFITAEPSTSVTGPNGERILWANVSKD
jgi:hypothetical protein